LQTQTMHISFIRLAWDFFLVIMNPNTTIKKATIHHIIMSIFSSYYRVFSNPLIKTIYGMLNCWERK